MEIYTIGHSTRKADVFLDLLRQHSIDTLADVRTIPRSRFNPQYNREILATFLQENGIHYFHFPDLGGLRKPLADSQNTAWQNPGFRGYADYMLTEKFDRAVKELIETVSHSRWTLMCAEAVYWRCHRMLLSDALLVRNVKVLHILDQKHLEEHVLTKFARVEQQRILYPSGEPYQPPLQ